MTYRIAVYGFGSFFSKEHRQCNDIDIVIIYGEYSYQSAMLAIALKNIMSNNIPKLHITMLSVSEENELDFISRSGSKLISQTDARTTSDIEDLAATLCQIIVEMCQPHRRD